MRARRLATTVLTAAAAAATVAAAPAHAASPADYGDAPDGAKAGYVTAPQVVGHFPSKPKSNGARHTDATGALRLGKEFDAEADSKQVNKDTDDDGFVADLRACHTSTLTFLVNASGLPQATRTKGHTAYLNALADFNRDGKWAGASKCGGGHKTGEWLVKNHPVDLSTFTDDPVQAVELKVPGGAQARELWMRATLTLDQKMTSPGRGAFTTGETEDYFETSPGGPTPKLKGHKKKKGKKAEHGLLADCDPDWMPHGTTNTVPIFFTDSISGKDRTPRPGSVDPSVANGTGPFPPLDKDVSAKAISYGFSITSLAKDDRANPIEWVLVVMKLKGKGLDVGPWTFGRQTADGVELLCPVAILHSHHVPEPDGPPVGGPPAGGGGPPSQPGGGSTTPPENQAPTAAFTFTPNNPPTGPKAGAVVQFDGHGSSDPDGTIKSWAWRVGAPLHGGNGDVSFAGSDTLAPTISFSAPGIYPVTLTVTDNGGKSATTTQNVMVSGPGSKDGPWTTTLENGQPDPHGCSGNITAFQDIYIPSYAQAEQVLRGTPTGGCAGATITITKITRTKGDAPPDEQGHPRVDEWGNTRDTVHIEFTVSGGTSAQGTIPFTANWQ